MLLLLSVAAPARAAVAPAPVLDTAITDGVGEDGATELERPAFAFAATLGGSPLDVAQFRCSVDDAPPEPCASPFQTDPLDDGGHTFSVFAEDPARLLADPTPARRNFAVVSPEEECEEFDDEIGFEAEDQADCAEEADASRLPPEECLLRTARARLFTYAAQDRVRLVIRYTAFSPADAIVEYRLAGGRGPLRLGGDRQHLAKRGLLRTSERLTDAEMDRVRAARRFTVSITFPDAPRYCGRYDTRHLTIKRSIHNQLVWFQSDSIFGADS